MRRPSIDQRPSNANASMTFFSYPPSTDTSYNWLLRPLPISRDEANSTRLPSMLQPFTVSALECQVRRFGCPPVTGMMYTSVLLSYLAEYAIHLPSGEKNGANSSAGCEVSRVGFLPARSASQMSPP